MKLVIAGASGFVATEVIRQSLSIPKITSVIALARHPVSAPSNLGPNANISKLHSVTVESYSSYSEDVIKQLNGANACIWTVAITPSKSKNYPFDEVRRVCQEATLSGLQAMCKAHSEYSSPGDPPFRFLYMSGSASERDQTKTPSRLAKYCLMRGETENQVLAFAAEQKGAVEACVAKPGFITAPGQILKNMFATVLSYTISLPNIDVRDVSAAMLHEITHGFEKEPLDNEDLVRIGRQALEATES